MKFLKLIFSRLVIISLSILLQIFIFITTNFYLAEYFAWANVWFGFIAVITLLGIISKSEPSSYKLPWVIIIMLFPIVGITLYFLFGKQNLSSKKQLQYFNKKNEYRPIGDIGDVDQIKDVYPLAYGQAKYIFETSLLPSYTNSYCRYLKTGEEFFKSLLEELNKAKKYIFFEYFIIGEGKMWNEIYDVLKRKVKEGVEVYLMYDDVGSISKVKNNFVYKLRDEGIYAAKFNPLKAIVSVRYNNRDHRKITVIDGEIGFISGANISDEYINEVNLFGIWKDNALLLKGKCVDSLVYMFLELYNFASIKHLLAKDFLCNNHIQYEEDGYIIPYGDGPRPIYEDYIGMNVYLNIINQAKDYIYITTPYLIVEHEFVQALINARKRGVDIKIITPEIPDKRVIKVMTKSNYFELIKAGIKIYEFTGGFIHAKMILSDDQYGVVGTINFDYRSFVHHFECGVWLYKCHCLNDIKSDFNDLFDTKTTEININKAKLNIFERVVNIFLGAFSPLL